MSNYYNGKFSIIFFSQYNVKITRFSKIALLNITCFFYGTNRSIRLSGCFFSSAWFQDQPWRRQRKTKFESYLSSGQRSVILSIYTENSICQKRVTGRIGVSLDRARLLAHRGCSPGKYSRRYLEIRDWKFRSRASLAWKRCSSTARDEERRLSSRCLGTVEREFLKYHVGKAQKKKDTESCLKILTIFKLWEAFSKSVDIQELEIISSFITLSHRFKDKYFFMGTARAIK